MLTGFFVLLKTQILQVKKVREGKLGLLLKIHNIGQELWSVCRKEKAILLFCLFSRLCKTGVACKSLNNVKICSFPKPICCPEEEKGL